jgi:hypothetical protein
MMFLKMDVSHAVDISIIRDDEQALTGDEERARTEG